MAKHEKYMAIALKLAEKGKGRVFPNPLVGAVLVKNDQIVGRGYHQCFGGPHAEINALKNTRDSTRGATIYVNLEPCCHYGKTPPCTDAIIKAGIRKVIISIKDPNPLVYGKGIAQLKSKGIKVKTGVLKEKAKILNQNYIKYITKKMPFVTLKWAMSIDGKIATKTGSSKWISNQASRLYTQQLRMQSDAILVGINTVLKDNPELVPKLFPKRKNPVRIILDTYLRTPLKAKVLDGKAPTIIVTGIKPTPFEKKQFIKRGVEILFAPSKYGRINLKLLMKKLVRRGISKILVEGGGQVHASFLENRLADKIIAIISPLIIGGRQAVTPVEGKGINKIFQAIKLKDIRITRFQDNIFLEGEL